MYNYFKKFLIISIFTLLFVKPVFAGQMGNGTLFTTCDNNDPTYPSCISATVEGGWTWAISPDRQTINFVMSGAQFKFIQIANQDWSSFYFEDDKNSKVWNIPIDYFPDLAQDGMYSLIFDTNVGGQHSGWDPIIVYIKDHKIYATLNDINNENKMDTINIFIYLTTWLLTTGVCIYIIKQFTH